MWGLFTPIRLIALDSSVALSAVELVELLLVFRTSQSSIAESVRFRPASRGALVANDVAISS